MRAPFGIIPLSFVMSVSVSGLYAQIADFSDFGAGADDKDENALAEAFLSAVRRSLL